MKQILKNILEQKEKRFQKVQLLSQKFQKTTICLKVNYPGADKKTEISENLFKMGISVFENLVKENGLELLFQKEVTAEAEYEFFAVINDSNSLEIKKLLIELEDNHSLGRLWDFDIYDPKGNLIKRTALNCGNRKCFLCANDANFCKKNKTHSTEQLLEKIEELYKLYSDNKI